MNEWLLWKSGQYLWGAGRWIMMQSDEVEWNGGVACNQNSEMHKMNLLNYWWYNDDITKKEHRG